MATYIAGTAVIALVAAIVVAWWTDGVISTRAKVAVSIGWAAITATLFAPCG